MKFINKMNNLKERNINHMNCHLCKTDIEKPYWLSDLKFCKNCYDGIVTGDFNKLINIYEKDYRLMSKSFIGETIHNFFCNGFFGSRTYDLEGATITKVYLNEDDDIVIEVRKTDGLHEYGYFEGDWADWEYVYEHLNSWTKAEQDV